MHTLLDHDGLIPAFVQVTEASVHDSKIVKMLDLPEGSIVVFDKAYNNYKWFGDLNTNGISFVTRLKSNAVFTFLEKKPLIKSTGVTSDGIIQVHCKDFNLSLRRIGYCDSKTGKNLIFLSNNFKMSSRTIADIYKDRWKIELFFKEIKQNLRIKRFVGRSKNAVLIQIYTTLVVSLLLAYIKFLSQIGISVQTISQLIKACLFGPLTLAELLVPWLKKEASYSNISRMSEIP